ncbi:hypothetical protein JI721_12280 [Alicyclobacillus cycloheptanicus]|uniref:Membrane protein n=1 Tax=Alicyclobacillus cycloheptanicus TaxID=1457 RepID=A0ABT9XGB4_9BACL|nr:hypothetical protein [Alicyclobacillus cycloheptanicus]MDQ0188868.1 putative membrane protein [Alicyclobacillus cycloheptanicus]WDM00490.1 hypothetical protein JI721_12280 [Alicyclobacillus cycloheptanicus]
MSGVHRWHFASLVLILAGFAALKFLPIVGIPCCFVLCNVALCTSIRERHTGFGVTAVAISLAGMVLSFVCFMMLLISAHQVWISQYGSMHYF